MDERRGVSFDSPNQLSLYEQGRQVALTYIGFSHTRTSGKVLEKLKQKGIPEPVAGSVVEELVLENRIDDFRACRNILLRHRGSHAKSRRQLVFLLIQQGATEKAARAAVNELAEDSETLADLLESEAIEDEKDRQRLTRRLMGRGFSYSDISDALRKHEQTHREELDWSEDD